MKTTNLLVSVAVWQQLLCLVLAVYPGTFYSILLKYNRSKNEGRSRARAAPMPSRIWAKIDPPAALGSLGSEPKGSNRVVRSLYHRMSRVGNIDLMELGTNSLSERETEKGDEQSARQGPVIAPIGGVENPIPSNVGSSGESGVISPEDTSSKSGSDSGGDSTSGPSPTGGPTSGPSPTGGSTSGPSSTGGPTSESTPTGSSTPGSSPTVGSTPGPSTGSKPACKARYLKRVKRQTPVTTSPSGATSGTTSTSGTPPGTTSPSGTTPGTTPPSGTTPGTTPPSGTTPGTTPPSGATPGTTPPSGTPPGTIPPSDTTSGPTSTGGTSSDEDCITASSAATKITCGDEVPITLDPTKYASYSSILPVVAVETKNYGTGGLEDESTCTITFKASKECTFGLLILRVVKGYLRETTRCEQNYLEFQKDGVQEGKYCGDFSNGKTTKSTSWNGESTFLLNVKVGKAGYNNPLNGIKAEVSGYCFSHSEDFMKKVEALKSPAKRTTINQVQEVFAASADVDELSVNDNDIGGEPVSMTTNSNILTTSNDSDKNEITVSTTTDINIFTTSNDVDKKETTASTTTDINIFTTSNDAEKNEITVSDDASSLIDKAEDSNIVKTIVNTPKINNDEVSTQMSQSESTVTMKPTEDSTLDSLGNQAISTSEPEKNNIQSDSTENTPMMETTTVKTMKRPPLIPIRPLRDSSNSIKNNENIRLSPEALLPQLLLRQ